MITINEIRSVGLNPTYMPTQAKAILLECKKSQMSTEYIEEKLINMSRFVEEIVKRRREEEAEEEADEATKVYVAFEEARKRAEVMMKHE